MRICKHFGKCGGCSFQDIDYKEELKIKEENIKKLMEFYQIPTTLLRPINYYNEWFYRNKMEFSFSYNNDIVCGLYAKGNNSLVVDIEECLIFSLDLPVILKTLKEFVKERSYIPYNKFSRKGFLRNFIVRETKFSKELMIGIVTTSHCDFDKVGFVKAFSSLKLSSNLKSIYLITNNSLSDAVIFDKKELIYKDEFIFEDLDKFKFIIGINSFFQANSEGALDFYKKIKKYASLKKENVLDLFCGIGGIGIFLSEDAQFVFGVELNKDAISNAIENAKINNIKNISFYNSDVRKFLNLEFNYKDISLLVVNPPRAGISNKIKRAILRLNPKVIIYSSCNPTTFFRDIKDLSLKYNINFVEPFDFFPKTPHTEILGYLKIKD